jgi:hypothetical protein
MRRAAESAEVVDVHTPFTPASTRAGRRIITEFTSEGSTIGWTRYVRAQPSDVLSSRSTVPIGIPAG